MLTNPNTGKFYKTGDPHSRPDLVSTFEILAAKGANEFYEGQMAEEIVKTVQEAGGVITLDDLKNYQATVYEAPAMNLSDSIMHTIDPPGGGLLLGFMMNVARNIEGIEKKPRNTEEWGLFYHRMVEVFKHAYALRSGLEDRAYGRIEQDIKKLKSDEFAKKIAKRIRDDRTFESKHYEDGVNVAILDDHGTAHMSVIDKFGNAVAVTSTINI